MNPFRRARRLAPVGKRTFDARADVLRTELLTAQFELRDRDFPVVLVLAGADRESALDVVNRLTEWLDARLLDLNFRAETTDDERERPYFWRWFTRAPARGRIGVFPLAWAEDRLRAELHRK